MVGISVPEVPQVVTSSHATEAQPIATDTAGKSSARYVSLRQVSSRQAEVHSVGVGPRARKVETPKGSGRRLRPLCHASLPDRPVALLESALARHDSIDDAKRVTGRIGEHAEAFTAGLKLRLGRSSGQ